MRDVLKISAILLFAAAQVHATPTVRFIDRQERSLRNLNEFPETLETLQFTSPNMNRFFAILFAIFNQKLAKMGSWMETSLENLCEAFNQKLVMSESKILSELGSQSKTINAIHQNTKKAVADASNAIVEEIDGDSGIIEFQGQDASHLNRKTWIITDDTNWWNYDFVLEENNLGPNSHLILWSSWGDQHVYSGSQVDWEDVKQFKGVTFLVTLTTNIVDSDAAPPSFKLRFNGTRHGSSYKHSHQVITTDEPKVVSYPRHNARDYSLMKQFVAVIAPPNAFNMTLKYFDVPGSPPQCTSYFDVFLLQESVAGPYYEKMSQTEHRQCGRVGDISEFLGSSTSAIVQFYPKSDATETGKGFSVEILPSDNMQ